MASAKGRCKICDYTASVGSADTPRDIAAEGVMESVQNHIFDKHCDDNLELEVDEYDSVGNAWEYI